MTAAAPTAAASLADDVLEHARLRPGAPALVWRGSTVDYATLADLVHDARQRLLSLGSERPVGMLARKSPQAVALILGCLLVRRPVFVPSPSLPGDALDELFEQAGCAYVLRPDDHACEVSAVRSPRRRPGRDIAMILTTSGSTGVPKIVPLGRASLDRFTAWAAHHFALTRATRVLSYAPLNFDLCLLEIWATLRHGGTVVLVEHGRATDGAHLLELIAEVEVVQGVPLLYRLITEEARDRRPRLDSVRHVLVTGDKIAPSALTALAALFGRARFHNVYGCTETNDSFVCELDLAAVAASGEIPIGKPLPGVDAVVVAGREVLEGPGEGELWVSTPFQTAGYLGATAAADRFATDPRGISERTYFRTGDTVRCHDDGSITLCGRSDGLVKVAGVRVSTHAVEQALLEHEAVVEAAVLAVPDALTGSRLHATVRHDEHRALDSLVLRRHCAARLERAAIPFAIDIVTQPLPRTPTGKVDRRRSVSHQARSRAA